MQTARFALQQMRCRLGPFVTRDLACEEGTPAGPVLYAFIRLQLGGVRPRQLAKQARAWRTSSDSCALMARVSALWFL